MRKPPMDSWVRTVGLGYSSSLIGFGTFLLLAKLLGPDQYATVAIGIAIGGFFVPMLSLGGERTFVKDALSLAESEPVSDLVNLSYSSRLFMLSLVIPISLIVAVGYVQTPSEALAVSIFAIWFGLAGLSPATWYDYCEKTELQNAYVFIERIASMVAIACYGLAAHSSVDPLILGLILLAIRALSIRVQVSVWFARYSPGSFRLQFRPPKFDAVGIDLRITAAVLLNAVMTYGTQLVVAKFVSRAEVSAYGIAFQLMSLCFLFQGQALRLVNRTIAEATTSVAGIVQSLRYTVLVITGGTVLLAVVAWLVSLLLPLALSGAHFSKASLYTPVLAAWVVVAGVGLVLTQHAIVLGQQRFYLEMACAGAVMSLVISLVAVRYVGVNGAAIALLVSHSVVIMLHALRLRSLVFERRRT